MKNGRTAKPATNEDGPMDGTDYLVGWIYVVLGAAAIGLFGWLYWSLHGGGISSFSFWKDGDKKWLEVLFWSLFTTLAWNITDVGYAMSDRSFKKRWAWWYIARTFEAPPISFALVFVLVNLGVTFGKGATLSLQNAPVEIVIALAIISSFFAGETMRSLQVVASWFTKAISEKLGTDTPTPK